MLFGIRATSSAVDSSQRSVQLGHTRARRSKHSRCADIVEFQRRPKSVTASWFFFARRPIGSCNLVLFVHHRLMRGEKSVHDSRIGAEPFVHCETWDILVKIMTNKIWIMDEKQQQKNKGGARQEPRHPPARCPETRQRKKPAKPQHDPIFNS